MKVRLFSTILLASVACAGCGWEQDRNSEQSSTSEETGDFFASAPDSFRLSSAPLLVVGMDDVLPLHHVRAAFFLGSRIVIADSGPDQILILDDRGHLLVRSGRQGAGPGDFRFLAGLARYSDGMIAWDAGLSRLSILDASGRYLSSTTVAYRSRTRLVGAFGGNVLLHWYQLGFPGDEPVAPLEVRMDEEFSIVRASDGTIVRTIVLPGEEQWAERKATTNGGLPIIFGREAAAAVAGGQAYLGTTDSLSIRVYNSDGESTLISFEHAPVQVEEKWTAFMRDSLLRAISARGPSPLPPMDDGRNVGLVLRDFDLSLLDGLPARATLPSYASLKGGSDGRLWIREYAIPGQPLARWIGLDASGRPDQMMLIPAHFEIQDISDSKVTVLAKGPYDQDIVEVYAIEPWSP